MRKNPNILMVLIRAYLYGIVCFQGSGLISCQIYHTGINSSAYLVLFLILSWNGIFQY